MGPFRHEVSPYFPDLNDLGAKRSCLKYLAVAGQGPHAWQPSPSPGSQEPNLPARVHQKDKAFYNGPFLAKGFVTLSFKKMERGKGGAETKVHIPLEV